MIERAAKSSEKLKTAADAVVAENVDKTFKQGDLLVHAIRRVGFRIPQGQFVAVMGASGSGKSTLLHLLGGLLRPDNGGRVIVDGDDLTTISDRALTQYRRDRIGLVFQSYNLIPTLSAEANIRVPLLLKAGRNGEGERIDHLLEMLGLTGRRKHYPRQLSGGEQQRVAIGRALANDPAVLLADEPTGNLDLKTSRQICELLRKLRDEEGRTIMMVTHAPHVAAWADRILMLRDGAVVTDAPVSDFGSSHDLGAKYQEMLETVDTSEAGEEEGSPCV